MTINANTIDLNLLIFGQLKRQKSKIIKKKPNAFQARFGSIPVFVRGFSKRLESTSKSSINVNI
jgi:hypothetical protein